jgi:uncharacterized protein (TIGR03437 family)
MKVIRDRRGFEVKALAHTMALLAICAAGTSRASAQGYTVTAVVGDQTERPDGGGTFSPRYPSVDGNIVVFNQGDLCAGCAAPDSIWAANLVTGELRKLVGAGTPAPGGTDTFTSFDAGPIVRNGIVVFIGFASNKAGLYAVPAAGGAVIKLAASGTAIPGASRNFSLFSRNSFHHDGSTAVFTGGTPGATGVYSVRLDGTGLTRIADSNTPVNSDTCSFSPVVTYSKPSISGGNFAFLGQAPLDDSVSFTALYTTPLSRASTATCTGPSPSVANSVQELPGNSGEHIKSTIDYGRIDGATLFLRAVEGASGFGGIFSTGLAATASGGPLTSIVNTNTQLPGWGRVPFFGNFLFAVDAGNVIFQAHDSSGQKSALFLAAGGALSRIAGTGDAVGASTLAAVDAPGAAAVSGAAVAFTAMTSIGSRAIYIARPQPLTVPAIAISAVMNAASYSAASVSPGEIVVIKGSGIGPDAPVAGAFDQNSRLTPQVAGVRVLFDGLAAPLLYVTRTQVSAIVPYALDGHVTTQVAVEYQGVASQALTLKVSDAVPGIFSADASGVGQAAMLNEDGSPNAPGNPAAPGSIVVLFATGEGQTAPGGVDGQMANGILPKSRLPVSVTVAGQAAEILYQGAAAGEVAGLMQVNLRLPLGVASGNAAIALQVGSFTSQPGLTVAVK